MNDELKKALELRKNGRYEECYLVMTKLGKEFPDDPQILYQCAWSCDNFGKEEEAVGYYEAAIKLGLAGDDLEDAYLGLGSTYRTLGNYSCSKTVLEKGIEQFPQNQALRVFYSMTLYNLNEHEKAMTELLNCLVNTTDDPNIVGYKKAIQFYADKLNEVWK
ncbi:tetratricopeptide repeat protein [Robertmurraya sp. FSL W8-0741]|uniref:tetratricopeptide repeat protein n=1 Tax=Robertmurraya TaxID=2837507 RepID=UPI000BA64503|nr:tetratricopeptide repeat protein [Robertmurraya siralis]PAE21559.1 hypothetical protein CHH80_06590 [Bacillus sp. 7504-2]